MMDDLRDYRFYEQDMIHPTSWAEEYIFQSFSRTFMEPTTLQIMEEWESIRKMMAHRPQHGLTSGYRSMLIQLQVRLERLAETLPVEKELAIVSERLNEFPEGM
jgi:hypothetical protein